jgi:sporulation protein YlmC with PRC-barrel domain
VSIRLSELLRRTVVTEANVSLGRVFDLVIRLDSPHPRVVRMRIRGATTGDVPATLVSGYEGHALVASSQVLVPPALALDELLLRRHVLDAQIVDLAGRRVTRVGDIELELDGSDLTVGTVSVGAAPVLRRLGLHRLASRARPDSVDWRDLHLTARRGHELLLDSSAAAVHEADPEELRHLVAQLPDMHGREVLAAVGSDAAEAASFEPPLRRRRFHLRWMRRRAST